MIAALRFFPVVGKPLASKGLLLRMIILRNKGGNET
jgi:hypothetical protein